MNAGPASDRPIRQRSGPQADSLKADMFKRIVCPIDLKKLSMAALEIASTLAEQNHATVSLVHVVPSPLPRPLEPVPDWERTVNTRIKRLAQKHFGDRVRWDTVILRGDPARAVMHAADDLEADLIVMATHGRKGN